MLLVVLFWILYILALFGVFLPEPWQKPSRVVLFILIGILGLKVFGNPLNG